MMINAKITVKRIRMRTNFVTMTVSILLALLSSTTISSVVTVTAFRTTKIRTHRSNIRHDGDGARISHVPSYDSVINPLTMLLASSPPSSSESTSESRPAKKKMKTKKKTAADTFLLLEKLDEQIDSYEGRLPSKMTAAQKTIDGNIDTEGNNDMNANTTTITNVNNDDHQQQHRCGYAGIVGAPNMGKSTLLNSLLKEDLCIATRRPQTTRHAILGVLSSPTKQCCLLDTPGVLQGDGAYQLQANMMEAVKGALTDSDMIVVVTDLFSTPIPDDNVFRRLSETTKPVLVVVNKIDLEGRAKRPDEATIQRKKDDEEEEEDEFEKTYTVVEAVEKWRLLLPNALAIIPLTASVSNNDESDTDEHPGISLLRQILIGCSSNDDHDIPAMVRALGRPIPGMFRNGVKSLTNDDVKQLLPIGPPLYDDDFLSDRSVRFFCSELIREALLESRYLKKELPYCCEVQITDYKEPRDDNITRIEATIFVERDGQKAIIIGKNGDVVKQVGIIAREKIERFLDGEKVFLQLRVKINKDWRKREDQLAKFGYSN